MSPIIRARRQLEALRDPERARQQARFFRTGPGQYGEGDVFWGIPVPAVRGVAKACAVENPEDVETLLDDPVHEARLCGLLMLAAAFDAGDAARRDAVAALYLRRLDRVNNWDLVDLSARILGEWLLDKDRSLLDRLAESPLLWAQRVAVVCTLTYIRRGDYADTLRLCANLRRHPHDLMHKAMGWMLRETGKRDKAVLETFLTRYGAELPRVMLRYAIERFPEEERRRWLRDTRALSPRRPLRSRV